MCRKGCLLSNSLLVVGEIELLDPACRYFRQRSCGSIERPEMMAVYEKFTQKRR